MLIVRIHSVEMQLRKEGTHLQHTITSIGFYERVPIGVFLCPHTRIRPFSPPIIQYNKRILLYITTAARVRFIFRNRRKMPE